MGVFFKFGIKVLCRRKLYVVILLLILGILFFTNSIIENGYRIYIEKLKGIYPPIYIESLNPPRLEIKDEIKDGYVTKEFLSLDKNKIVIKLPDEKKLLLKNVSVRSFDERFIPFLLKDYSQIVKDRKNVVFVTPELKNRLSELLKKENEIIFIKGNREIKTQVKTVDAIVGESWLIIPNYMVERILSLTPLQEKSCYKMVIYPKEGKEDRVLKEIPKEYSVETWIDLVPFSFRAFYFVVEKGYSIFSLLFVAFSILLILTVWTDIAYDFRKYIGFSFLFGVDKKKLILYTSAFSLFIVLIFIVLGNTIAVGISLLGSTFGKVKGLEDIFKIKSKYIIDSFKYLLFGILSLPLLWHFVEKNYRSPIGESDDV
ncbi:MAG: hypothetical protein ABGX27_07115 [Desulfurobacteriaceae bacterium]